MSPKPEDDAIIFRPQSNDVASKKSESFSAKPVDPEAAHAPHEAPLKRKLQSRHLQMIAIGGKITRLSCVDGRADLSGIIGPGLLVGSGNALSEGGPAGILISFSLVGIIVFFVMYAVLRIAGEESYLY